MEVKVKKVLKFTWWIIRWLFARLVVVLALGIAVHWGGLFYEPFEWFRGIVTWLIIWAAIEYYAWHTRKFD